MMVALWMGAGGGTGGNAACHHMRDHCIVTSQGRAGSIQ
jgi:hypothetical protein